MCFVLINSGSIRYWEDSIKSMPLIGMVVTVQRKKREKGKKDGKMITLKVEREINAFF